VIDPSTLRCICRAVPSPACPAAPLALERRRGAGCRCGNMAHAGVPVPVYTARTFTASRGSAVAVQPDVHELNPLEELLAATARGDRRAFRQVYQLSGRWLFGIALRTVGRRELAEEVVQEAFVSIWRKAGQYRPERGEPLAWMTRIVRNRAIDRLRAERRTPREAASLDEIPEAWLADGAAEAAVAGHDERALHGCLGKLKNDQRKSIVLAYYYGLTHEELAARLDAPLGTVKSWVRRGLLQLKDCLEQ